MVKKCKKIALIVLGVFVFTGCSEVSKIPINSVPSGGSSDIVKVSTSLKDELANQSNIKKFASIKLQLESYHRFRTAV